MSFCWGRPPRHGWVKHFNPKSGWWCSVSAALLSGDGSISAEGKCIQYKFVKEHRIFRTEQCFITIKYGLSILPIYKRGNNF